MFCVRVPPFTTMGMPAEVVPIDEVRVRSPPPFLVSVPVPLNGAVPPDVTIVVLPAPPKVMLPESASAIGMVTVWPAVATSNSLLLPELIVKPRVNVTLLPV